MKVVIMPANTTAALSDTLRYASLAFEEMTNTMNEFAAAMARAAAINLDEAIMEGLRSGAGQKVEMEIDGKKMTGTLHQKK